MMYDVVQPDGNHLGPYNLGQLKLMSQQGQVQPETTVLDLATGQMVVAQDIPGLFTVAQPAPDMAWRDPDAMKLPPWRIVRVVLAYPLWLFFEIFSRRSSTIWTEMFDDDIFVLRNYCGVWGWIYMALPFVVCIGILAFAWIYAWRNGWRRY